MLQKIRERICSGHEFELKREYYDLEVREGQVYRKLVWYRECVKCKKPWKMYVKE